MKIILFLLLMLPLLSQAATTLQLRTTVPQIKQGSLTAATLTVNAEDFQNIQLQALKGTTFGKSLYFYQVGPWLRQEGQNNFTSSVSIIFTTAPDEKVLRDTVRGSEIEISLEGISLIPTEAAQELIFGEFTIPAKPQLILWGSVIAGLLLLVLLGVPLFRKWSRRKKEKQWQKELKAQLLSARSYDEVIEVWKKKRTFTSSFPQLEEPFRNLEGVLFKYQFKPSQNSDERDEVLKAYKKFVSDSESGLHGI